MGVLDLLFPKNCLNCGLFGQYICSQCLAKIRSASQICPYCEKPSIDGLTHIKCTRKFGLDGLICPWEYEGVIRKAILALKFKYATEVGKELSEHFINAIKPSNSLAEPDPALQERFLIPASSLLVPIPLHWHRENVRGFNQSIEVGKTVADSLGWKFVPDLLIKKKQTISQVELRGDERRQNLRGVFALNPSYKLHSTSCILFDDVFTTGSTLIEAAKVLKHSGVEKVWGLTIAR